MADMSNGPGRTRGVVVVTLAVLAVSVAILSLFLGVSDGLDEFGLVAWVLSASVLGAFIELKTSGNRMARILLATGVLGSVAAVSSVLMPSGEVNGLTVSQAIWGGLGAISYFSFLWSTFGLLPSVFPTGQALSRRWAWVVRVGISALVVAVPAALFSSYQCVTGGAGVCEAPVRNPIGVSWMPHPEYGLFGSVLLMVFSVTILSGLASMVVRFIRSRGVERQQIKWLLVAVAINVLWLLGEDFIWVELLGRQETTETAIAVMEALSWASIPVAIAIAVLKYRLYEIDRIISRTVSYAVVVGLLVAAVAGVAALAGSQFQEPWVVAATTLGVAAVFNPLRRRVQGVVDRHFNRSRYDAEQIMDGFVATLRDRVDPAGVVDGWLGVVSETVQPAARGVWVKD